MSLGLTDQLLKVSPRTIQDTAFQVLPPSPIILFSLSPTPFSLPAPELIPPPSYSYVVPFCSPADVVSCYNFSYYPYAHDSKSVFTTLTSSTLHIFPTEGIFHFSLVTLQASYIYQKELNSLCPESTKYFFN